MRVDFASTGPFCVPELDRYAVTPYCTIWCFPTVEVGNYSGRMPAPTTPPRPWRSLHPWRWITTYPARRPEAPR